MKILVTGANGFVGKNLVSTLINIKDGKDRTHSIDKPFPAVCIRTSTERPEALDKECCMNKIWTKRK